ncbi:DUF2142 domain-containing protein [Acidovorax sp. LjRoot66]|uniref:DUF2142 domain-containing protein n=1 Tax=Acidovorax sp. LjRoot66 TaxID=3342334 RepID=UPI003ED1586C
MGVSVQATATRTGTRHLKSRIDLRTAGLPALVGGLLLALVVAWGLMRLVPAFQSPDENVHLLRADMIAHGQWTLRKDEPDEFGNQGGYVDRNFVAFTSRMRAISGTERDYTASASALMAQAAGERWAHKDLFVNAVGTGYYAPFIYLPHALGLRTARALDLSMRASYELTRLLVAATALGLIAWAWRLFTPNLLVRALVLMPMAMFQIISPTIDGLSIASALLLAALFSVRCMAPRSDANPLQEYALYACIFLLVTSRVNLAPLLLLPLWLLVRRFSAAHLLAWIALCAACAGWTLYGIATTADARLVRNHATIEILAIYLQHPLAFMRLVLDTLLDGKTGYFYAYSFVGMMGWLDASITKDAMKAVWYGLAVALAATLGSARWLRRDAAARALLLLVALASCVLVFLALAISWNDYPVAIISGVQGRYFIVPALLGATALGPMGQAASPTHRTVANVLTATFALASLYIMATTLSERYALRLL